MIESKDTLDNMWVRNLEFHKHIQTHTNIHTHTLTSESQNVHKLKGSFSVSVKVADQKSSGDVLGGVSFTHTPAE